MRARVCVVAAGLSAALATDCIPLAMAVLEAATEAATALDEYAAASAVNAAGLLLAQVASWDPRVVTQLRAEHMVALTRLLARCVALTGR
jgi:hypothetical protein